MIKSMTGFGQASADDGQTRIYAEVKSLNSKYLDLNIRLPKLFSDKELEVRNLISEKLERGKVSVVLEYERHGDATLKQSYNEPLFVAYYSELKKLADRVYASYADLFQLALNSPDVIQSAGREEVVDDELDKVKEILLDAIAKCEGFRVDEGKVLSDMLASCCSKIAGSLEAVVELDPKRIARIRERLRNNVSSFLGEENFDTNRLEQEIIYYVEKLDINEEKVRLKSHLDYFMESLRNSPTSNGKKLGFISQEIGREINTIGSKCNDADIQKHVVLMKEELEKIKEQLGNIV